MTKRSRSSWPVEGEIRLSKRHDEVDSDSERVFGTYAQKWCRVPVQTLGDRGPGGSRVLDEKAKATDGANTLDVQHRVLNASHFGQHFSGSGGALGWVRLADHEPSYREGRRAVRRVGPDPLIGALEHWRERRHPEILRLAEGSLDTGLEVAGGHDCPNRPLVFAAEGHPLAKHLALERLTRPVVDAKHELQARWRVCVDRTDDQQLAPLRLQDLRDLGLHVGAALPDPHSTRAAVSAPWGLGPGPVRLWAKPRLACHKVWEWVMTTRYSAPGAFARCSSRRRLEC